MWDCVEKVIHKSFYKYGGFIAKHPLPFLLLPLLITGGLGAGMVFLTSENDIEALFAPENSPAFDARDTIENLYDEFVDNDLLPRHLPEIGLFGQVIIRQKSNENVLTIATIKETLRLHDLIMNVSVNYSKKSFTFSDMCLTSNAECDKIDVLDIISFSSEEYLTPALTYPFTNNSNGKPVFIGSELGGVSFENNGINVAQAKFMQFTYHLRYYDTEGKTVGLLWEKEFLNRVSHFESNEVIVYRSASQSLEAELGAASKAAIPMFCITFTILINFSIWSSVMMDNVRSKPWLASLGVLSAGFAVISSFGLMGYVGVPYINVVGSAPFLILGIGVDDMFIMLAAWRQTNVHKSTVERMSESFGNAAMSITITSVTDALAFGIGSITYFRSVRIFCLYTGVAVLFDYIYQITFFAACMALMGRREEKNLHAMTCRKVLPKKEAPSTVYRIFCAGGSSPVSPNEADRCQENGANNETQHALMLFFKHYFGPFITHTYTAIGIVILYTVYLALAIWGLFTLEEGLQRRNLSLDSSYVGVYDDVQSKYFREYGPVVSIVVTEKVDYSNFEIQEQLNRTLAEFEESDYFHGNDFTTSWFRQFIEFLKRTRNSNYALTERIFLEILQKEFLMISDYRQFLPDIKFDPVSRSIISSRFYVISKNVNTPTRERDMMIKAREIAKKSALPIIAYHPAFVFYDQFIEIRPNTIQNLGIALGAMFLVSVVMVPHLLCSILITVSLISILVGVIGFMSHWNVALDTISMINLILCMGFSVDFSAHISYGFITAPGKSSRERAIQTLYSLGMPITQGALSTILAVVILASSDSYIFRTFFKTMFLVICFGALHGLVFLPVFLMILVPFKPNTQSNKIDEHSASSRRQDDTLSNCHTTEDIPA